MNLFRNKYRIASARAPWWDYGSNASYFVTICTKNRAHFFGECIGGKMNLSAMGHIANSCWYEIPNHFPFVILGAHVIMPNHVHGIITINKPPPPSLEPPSFEPPSLEPPSKTEPPKTEFPKNKFGPQSKNLASIIRGFKVGVTKNARQINPNFAWQARYHDHIIRNNNSMKRISNYIKNNPVNWKEDKFYTL